MTPGLNQKSGCDNEKTTLKFIDVVVKNIFEHQSGLSSVTSRLFQMPYICVRCFVLITIN